MPKATAVYLNSISAMSATCPSRVVERSAAGGLELPAEFRQFDYNTISDVIIHMNYTAKEGGDDFKDIVNQQIRSSLNYWLDEVKREKQGLFRLFSLKQDFPNQLSDLLHSDSQAATLPIAQKHYPYLLKDETMEIKSVALFLKGKDIKGKELADLTINIKDPEDLSGFSEEDALIKQFECVDQARRKCMSFEPRNLLTEYGNLRMDIIDSGSNNDRWPENFNKKSGSKQVHFYRTKSG